MTYVERMRKIQEETKATLGKVQKEMKKFANRKWGKRKEYKAGNLVLLSTKDLKWQIKGRRSKKLTEYFVGPYKVKEIILSNIVEFKVEKILNKRMVRGGKVPSSMERVYSRRRYLEK